MIEVAVAQLRHAASLLFGAPISTRALSALVEGLVSTRREFGLLGDDADAALSGPPLDEAMRRDLQLRRFRAMARRGRDETSYYGPVLHAAGVQPGHLTWDDIARLPLTPKAAMRAAPEAFVRRGAPPAFRTTTTGTTGRPTHTYFTAHEVEAVVLLNALTFLQRGSILPDDVVQVSTSSRATLGNQCFSRAIERIGAVWYQAGLVAPEIGLRLLTETHGLPDRKARASYLNTYSSYLGELVETAAAAGMGPADFGLATLSVGGEIVTDGLRRRARETFGDVRLVEGFGMTETWPLGAVRCEAGHLHWDPGHGLVEVVAIDSLPEGGAVGDAGDDASPIPRPAAPGELGVLVATPFAPYREAMVTLRYNTEDLVTAVAGPLDCSLRHMPATSDLLGKRRFAVRHAAGWTTPRDVLEALEALPIVPLPARCGFWADGDGVAVEVVTRGQGDADRRVVAAALEAQGVPLTSLHLAEHRDALRQPLPMRCDLREATF